MSKRLRKARERTESETAQSLSGAGAINPDVKTCLFTSTGGAQALTLAASRIHGHRIRIVHVVDGGSGVLTHGANVQLGPGTITAITLTNVQEWVELEYSKVTSKWNIVGCSPVAIVS
jgi:hypothetical protein